jgi:hypothetical protein
MELPRVDGAAVSATAVVPSVPLFVALTQDLLGAIRGDGDDALFATFEDGLRAAELADPILQRFDAARPEGGPATVSAGPETRT